MALASVVFIAVFLIIATSAFLVSSRLGIATRLASVVSSGVGSRNWLVRLRAQAPRDSLRAVMEPFEKVLPKSPAEVSVAQQRLIRAGYRDDEHLRIFYGSKFLIPALLLLLVFASGITRYFNPFIAYAMAAGLGYLAPDFWLGRRIKHRQIEIQLGLPDFLDLMVVCVEAGLSIDQALARTTRELQPSQPEIADEMGLVSLEQRAGRPRVDAWRNLAGRVNLEVIRTLVSAIIQADQFGTSIAKTLRVYSDSMRVRRRQDIEEKAARTAVKLVFPLVFCIFPALFVVTLGPSILVMADSIDKYFK